MTLQSRTLRGQHVQLEPYRDEHTPHLWQAGNHEELWRYMPWELTTEQQMADL